MTGNTVIDNSLSGILVEDTASYTTVVDNIVAQNGGWGVFGENAMPGTLPGNTAFGNLAWANKSGTYDGEAPGELDFSGGNLVGDPHFVDPTLRNYRVGAGSAAFGAARTEYAPLLNADAEPRGEAPNVGAY